MKKLFDEKSKFSSAGVFTLLADNFFWILGSALYASAVLIFAVPNSIAQSGFTGVSIMLNKLFDTPVGLIYLLLNVPLIVTAWIILG